MSCMDSYWTGCATLWPGSLLSLDWYKASITFWVWSNSTSIEDGHARLNLWRIHLWFHWHRDAFSMTDANVFCCGNMSSNEILWAVWCWMFLLTFFLSDIYGLFEVWTLSYIYISSVMYKCCILNVQYGLWNLSAQFPKCTFGFIKIKKEKWHKCVLHVQLLCTWTLFISVS